MASSAVQLNVPRVGSTEPHLPSFSGVIWFQYVAKSDRTAPLVVMLPTNLRLLVPASDTEPSGVEPPEPDPLEPEPEVASIEPELEPLEPLGAAPSADVGP